MLSDSICLSGVSQRVSVDYIINSFLSASVVINPSLCHKIKYLVEISDWKATQIPIHLVFEGQSLSI
jgi:hypothetical protein